MALRVTGSLFPYLNVQVLENLFLERVYVPKHAQCKNKNKKTCFYLLQLIFIGHSLSQDIKKDFPTLKTK